MKSVQEFLLRVTRLKSAGEALEAPSCFHVCVEDADGKRTDDSRLSVPQVFRVLRLMLRPSKTNLGSAASLGVVMILIQCLRAGYLPEFDWSSGAGAVVLASVLAIGVFLVAYLAFLAAVPALPLADIDVKLARRYLCMLLAYIVVILGVFLLVAFCGGAKRLNAWLDVGWHGVCAVIGYFVLTMVVATLAIPRPSADSQASSIWGVWETRFSAFIGLSVGPCVYLLLYLVLVRYRDGSFGVDVMAMLLPAVVVGLMVGLTLFRPRKLLVYYCSGLLVFGVFCIPASDATFMLLGLGSCPVEFSLADGKYASDLEAVGVGMVDQNHGVYSAWLRLRLGTEIVLSAGPDGWGRNGRVVSIPRDSVRGILIRNRVAALPLKTEPPPQSSNRPPCMGPCP